GRLREIHVVLRDTNNDPRNDVYCGNHNASNGIASNELRSTVHRTVKVSFFSNFFTTFLSDLISNKAGIQISINCHLFTRHRIQGETSSNLSNSSSTFGDHDKVNDYKNNENHDTD